LAELQVWQWTATSMKKFEGVLLFSDVDGTLLDNNGILPPRNRQAIRYFTQHGGLFSVATGRSQFSLAEQYADIGINAPCVVLNGCCTYDYIVGEAIDMITLNDHAVCSTVKMSQKFPQVNTCIFTNAGIAASNDTKTLPQCFDTEHVPHKTIHITEHTDRPWFKTMFVGDADELMEINRSLSTLNTGHFDTVFSGTNMLEVLPNNISKARGALHIAKRLGIDPKRVCAIGDYFNDYEMLSKAGISAAVGQAPDKLKQTATYVVCENNSGSVGEFIELLDQRFGV
jgi:Cof subfamily protein (haloacid dehalogenase superfamily)